jgi:hypothetical protein
MQHHQVGTFFSLKPQQQQMFRIRKIIITNNEKDVSASKTQRIEETDKRFQKVNKNLFIRRKVKAEY